MGCLMLRTPRPNSLENVALVTLMSCAVRCEISRRSRFQLERKHDAIASAGLLRSIRTLAFSDELSPMKKCEHNVSHVIVTQDHVPTRCARTAVNTITIQNCPEEAARAGPIVDIDKRTIGTCGTRGQQHDMELMS